MNPAITVSIALLVSIIISEAHAIDSIGHDSVTPITNSVVDEVHQKFMPWIDIEHGCDYQPAINSDGEVSAGLKTRGRSNGGCERMTGQVYARSADFPDGTTAIMYAYYFAKDHALWGGIGGHRHDWENVIVWIDQDRNVIGAAYSAHGDYSTTTTPFMIGTHVVVRYAASGTTHSFFESDATTGISQENLVSFDNLSELVRSNLIHNDWGHAVFPLKDRSFNGYIEESRPFDFPYNGK